MAKKMTFEQSVGRLEEIVRLLEGGEASLEESMKWYEEGAKLSAQLAKQLDEAEQKVKLMTETDEGALVETPFAEEG